MQRIRALDGLRALAVLAVLIQHGFFTEMDVVVSPGPIGVRLFFVLSGFLITGILIAARREGEQAGQSMRKVWRAFLVRRALRIFPLAYVAMTVAWVLGVPAMRDHGLWYWLYVGNIHSGTFGQAASNGMTYWWSLAVEEQFYVVWPLLILFAPRRVWQPITAGVIAIAAVARLLHVHAGGLWPAYVLTWCRMDALALGALLAMRRVDVTFMVMLAGGLISAAGVITGYTSLAHTLRESAMVVASGAVIVAIANGRLRSVFNWRPMVALGTISYGVYVWGGLTPPLFLPAVERWTGFQPVGGPQHFLAITTITVLLSMLSWFSFERPLNNLRRHFAYVPDRRAKTADTSERPLGVLSPLETVRT